MDAYSKDEEEDSSSISSMDKAVAIGIPTMQTLVAGDMANEVMVDVGNIDLSCKCR